MLPRFQHLLLPVDFTPKNCAAVDVAFEIAVENRARVTLLHVIERVDAADDEEIEQFYAKLQTRAATELERLTQRFADTSLVVDTKVRYGKRANEIVQYSIEHDVDLIVMSSHKIDIEQPIRSWGTVSYQVSILCQCPVLLVK